MKSENMRPANVNIAIMGGSCQKKNPLLLSNLYWKISQHSAYWSPVWDNLVNVIAELEGSLRLKEFPLLKKFLPAVEVDHLVPPALVLFSSRLFREKNRAELPALFMAIIQMGTLFHNQAGEKGGQEQQLLILTGDYLLSSLFHLLCEKQCLFLLERFADLITVMSEGYACREEGKHQQLQRKEGEFVAWLRKQYGAFYGECCALGCLFAGGTPEEQSLMRRFGILLGIAHGAYLAGCKSSSWAVGVLEEALSVLLGLPATAERNELVSFSRGIVQCPTPIV
ncbi:octaprenyl-diphosphate synthase [Thermacetogenium phaeum DSM 12270]|uniref:Octaprenyl-diphosphate synthase n=2 Tax=Thermacetogenium phaeum TaxID=85874 RepID=K4LI71_THEPS|nr:octaprenyl-diphosphate synthase [Thermacetogenium phaeum DSM 12270]